MLQRSSFGYASECLGQHLGDDQGANLGDGHGYRVYLDNLLSLKLLLIIL